MNKGKVWKYGDDVNTDVIFPGKYTYQPMEPAEMAEHAMEDLDPDFAKNVGEGDIIVAGKNFGCGSSREHAPLAIKGAGVSCVVAESFARIFYRNAINTGLPILTCPKAVKDAQRGDELAVDLAAGTVTNSRTGKTFRTSPFPPFIMAIIDAGGLVPYTREKLQA